MHASASDHGSQRILIVDDNADSAEMLAALLAFEGFRVEVVSDAAAALNCVDHFAPAVVLLDIGLPGMDGFELARRLRRRPHASRPLLIAISGWGSARDRELSRAAGIDHHFVKPVDTSALVQLLCDNGCPSANRETAAAK
jgi:DNA-binding response OmpR family regulator